MVSNYNSINLMQKLALASLAVVAVAQTNTSYEPAYFPTSTDGDVSSVGYLNEIVQISADGWYSAVFWAAWATTCSECNFKDNSIVQNWFQMDISDQTGKYTGFTCTTIYTKDQDYEDNPQIYNYRDQPSLATTPDNWNDGTQTRVEWWKKSSQLSTVYES